MSLVLVKKAETKVQTVERVAVAKIVVVHAAHFGQRRDASLGVQVNAGGKKGNAGCVDRVVQPVWREHRRRGRVRGGAVVQQKVDARIDSSERVDAMSLRRFWSAGKGRFDVGAV